MDTTSTIFKTARHFFSGTMLSRLSGLGRDMAMAFAFGATAQVAALMVAFRFAHLLRRLFGEGALQSAFIPQFEKLRNSQGGDEALAFFCHLRRLLISGLGGGIALMMGLLAACIQWGAVSEGVHEILLLTFILLPSLLFICLYGLYSALLQCHRSYFYSAVAPVAFNLVWTAAALGFYWLNSPQAIPLVAGSLVLGCFFQWGVTALAARPLLHSRPSSFSPHLKNILKPLAFGILGISATQINTALDALFARFASEEGPALLWYAIRLQQLPLSLFGVALSGALLPPLSRAFEEGDRSRYTHFLLDAIRKCLLLMIPMTLAIFLLGNWGVSLLFGHGKFAPSAIAGTTECLFAYGWGLVPMSLLLLLGPACYAQGDYKVPMIGSCLSVLLNVGLNALFVFGFHWGPTSIALATSISAWANVLFFIIIWAANRGLPKWELSRVQ